MQLMQQLNREHEIETETGPLLSAHGLTRVFEEGSRSLTVLSGVSFELFAGECVALLGQSGSGKSTLLHLLSGLDLPTSGHVHIAGVDLAEVSETERTRFRREHIGLVFQFFHLIPTLTVEENVWMPLDLAGRMGAQGRERSRELLARVGLDDRRTSFPDVLSGGERQRVALARALIHEPRLVLADEPTGNLDRENGEKVLALLTSICREHGSSVLMATHSRTAAEHADRVLLLANGVVRADR